MPMPREEFNRDKEYHNRDLYEEDGVIGKSNQAVVFRVVRDGRYYAMKRPIQFTNFYERTITDISEEMIKEYRNEAEFMNELSNRCSDSVVTLEDFGLAPHPWIVMEYAETDFLKAQTEYFFSDRNVERTSYLYNTNTDISCTNLKGEATTITGGSTFYWCRTDDKTYVDVITSDNKVYRLPITKDGGEDGSRPVYHLGDQYAAEITTR